MDDFLVTIALGEFIAASNAKLLSAFFRSENNQLKAEVYDLIYEDEIQHFQMMRSTIGRRGFLPPEMRRIYKGELLDTKEGPSIDCAFERMAVMHTVFEGASFAYMSLLARYHDQFCVPNLAQIARKIMIDEAYHMAKGFDAIDEIKNSVSSKRRAKTRDVVNLHAKRLRRLPEMTLDVKSEFSCALVHLYDSNVTQNIRRVFE